MNTKKYIEVIEHYNRLWRENAITYETAWWTTQAVIQCALKDDRTSTGTYSYICEYRDRLFE